jgi:hypothetical protein
MQRSWLIRFALTLGILTALAVWAAQRLPTYRDPPLDFLAMPQGQYFDTGGLTRRQNGGLKLGFAETHNPPPVGVFGNHIISFFGADAFDAPERGEVFFNYGYANLSLPETITMLRHLEALGRLPTRLMIVSITPPNADNGRFIIDHGDELPPDMALRTALRPGSPPAPGALAGALWRTLEVRLHEVFNYNTLILALLQSESRVRETGPVGCVLHPPSRPAWLDALPWTVRSVLGRYRYNTPCADEEWDWTLRRDGSFNPPKVSGEPMRNHDPLLEVDRDLRAGDEGEIARHLLAIDEIGRRNRIRVVFLVTPVFETDRRDSVVNQVFDRALALTPGLEIIDHRHMHDDPALFVDSLHPGPAYFRLVADELRRRGFLGEGEPVASLAPP